MRYIDLLECGRKILYNSEITDYDIDAWYLLEYVTNMSRAEYFLKREEDVPDNIEKKYKELISRRATHIPLQHITGSQEFMGLDFLVSKDVLVPRQDTETLVEYLLPLVKGKKVLDMCTGSGCIAISLMKLGEALACDASDYSKKALEIAVKNSELNEAGVNFIYSDMFENIKDKYDIIVSNPPYIITSDIAFLAPEVRIHEPFMALDGGDDGFLFYRIISSMAVSYLNYGGLVAVEIGYNQGNHVSELFKEYGFKNVEVHKDLSGNNRFVTAWI